MIVVSGASGLLGRALIKRLHKDRYPYAIIDRNALGFRTPLSSIILQRPSAIVHLAAVVPKPPIIHDNEINANITRYLDAQVLEAANHWGCHVIYASGCSLYPNNTPEIKVEKDAISEPTLTSPYLMAKFDGERSFILSGRATVLRISAPIGDGLSIATVLGRFIAAAKVGGNLNIWGSGMREQNYLDSEDIADALFRSAVIRPCELINISADHSITMLQLAQEIVWTYGSGVIRLLERPDPRDFQTARYSNQKASNILGWRQVTSIHTSLKRLSG